MSKNETIVMLKDLTSQQFEKESKEPFVNLKVGDTVELREDGIYFTRKVNLGSEIANLESSFNEIKKHGVVKKNHFLDKNPFEDMEIKEIKY